MVEDWGRHQFSTDTDHYVRTGETRYVCAECDHVADAEETSDEAERINELRQDALREGFAP